MTFGRLVCATDSVVKTFDDASKATRVKSHFIAGNSGSEQGRGANKKQQQVRIIVPEDVNIQNCRGKPPTLQKKRGRSKAGTKEEARANQQDASGVSGTSNESLGHFPVAGESVTKSVRLLGDSSWQKTTDLLSSAAISAEDFVFLLGLRP